MNFWQGVAYVLHHTLLWPLEFWLRPLDVIDRIQKSQQDWAELGCALVGGAVWGASIGILLWFWSGDAQAIWAIAGAFAIAVAGTIPLAVAVAVAGAGAGAGATIGIAIGIWLPEPSLFLSLGINFIWLNEISRGCHKM